MICGVCERPTSVFRWRCQDDDNRLCSESCKEIHIDRTAPERHRVERIHEEPELDYAEEVNEEPLRNQVQQIRQQVLSDLSQAQILRESLISELTARFDQIQLMGQKTLSTLDYHVQNDLPNHDALLDQCWQADFTAFGSLLEQVRLIDPVPVSSKVLTCQRFSLFAVEAEGILTEYHADRRTPTIHELPHLPLNACVTPIINEYCIITYSSDAGENVVLQLKRCDVKRLEPYAIRRKNHGAILYSGTLTIVGGSWGGELLSSVEEYDLTNSTWHSKTSMQVPVEHCAICEHDQCLFVYGGGSILQKRANNVWFKFHITPVPGSFFRFASVEEALFIFGNKNVYARRMGTSIDQGSLPWDIDRCVSSPIVAGSRILLLAHRSVVGLKIEGSTLISLAQPLLSVGASR